MPIGSTTTREQTHRERRCIDDANASFLEVVEVVGEHIVVQTVVAEAEDAFHRARLHMVDDPLQVLGLQVGNAHMAHHAFVAQLHQCRQRLVGHFLQTARQCCLKLDVVNIDEVDVVDAQSLHALIDAARDTLGRIVPHVDAILSIASHLCGEVVLVAWNLA